MTGTRVLRIVFDGTRVTGVGRSGRRRTNRGRGRVVVSAGGIHSPTLLLRSGIGPADELRKLGVAVVADRPGVGRNYQNHPQLHFAMALKRGSRMPAQAKHYIMASHRFSSGVAGGSPGDLFHYYTGRVSPKPFGLRMAMVACCLYAPASRGVVALNSADPNVPPRVEQGFLSEPLDRQRMIISARFAHRLLLHPAVRSCFEEIYLMPRQAPLRLINGAGLAGLAKAFARPRFSALRRRSAVPLSARRSSPDGLSPTKSRLFRVSDDDILDATGASFHPASTCAIGAADNPLAVVDPECRVYAVEGLRVADASVMPSIVSANTNMPTMMIGERVAEFIRAPQRKRRRSGTLD